MTDAPPAGAAPQTSHSHAPPPHAPWAAPRPDRAVLALAGPDRKALLQGLVSADLDRLEGGRALWGALLTPQGKYLHDFFIAEAGERLLIDCEAERRDDLARRLKIYRLRSKVEIADASGEFGVWVAWGEGARERLGLADAPGSDDPGTAAPWQGGVAFVDPRLAVLGLRLLLPRAGAGAALDGAGVTLCDAAPWHRLRLGEGVPEGAQELGVEKGLLVESGFDELGGIAWEKGCWMGQELTARMKYRALVKKRLLPVTLQGMPPADGTPILQEGREVGELRRQISGQGLALLRLDALGKDAPLTAGEAVVEARRPAWIALPEAAEKN